MNVVELEIDIDKIIIEMDIEYPLTKGGLNSIIINKFSVWLEDKQISWANYTTDFGLKGIQGMHGMRGMQQTTKDVFVKEYHLASNKQD